MEKLVEFLTSMFMRIASFVWDALVRYYDFIQDLLNKAFSWLMSQLASILPETAQNAPAVLADYLGLANYYFPVSELFVLLSIYLQFRIALFVVRGTVKLMTGGQV